MTTLLLIAFFGFGYMSIGSFIVADERRLVFYATITLVLAILLIARVSYLLAAT